MVGKKEKHPKQSKEREEIASLKADLQRVQAEFENYKKRTERERADVARYAAEPAFKAFLSILDNLELALGHVKEETEFSKGVEMIYANIIEMLSNQGVADIPALGLPFDPYRHEALMKKESDEPENTVIDVMQKGYVLHDKVIRPAKVVVSTGKKEHQKKKKE